MSGADLVECLICHNRYRSLGHHVRRILALVTAILGIVIIDEPAEWRENLKP